MHLTDLQGNRIGFLDGERIRDSSGKVVLARSSDDREELKLARVAADAMNNRLWLSDAEQKVLMDLGPGDVVQPSARAVVSLGQNDNGCVADQVSQVYTVTHDRGVVYSENVSDTIKIVLPNAAADGTPAEFNPSYTAISFTTTSYGLVAKLPRPTLGNADFDLKAQATRLLIEALRSARELRVATLLTTSGNWATANQVAAVTNWNGGTNSNPLVDMFAALGKSYLPACHIVLPEVAAQYFYAGPQGTATNSMRDYVQSGGEMPEVLFARAKNLVGGNVKYIWDTARPLGIAVVRSPADKRRIPTSMTLRWLGDEQRDQGRRVDGFLVRSYREPGGGSLGSDYVVVAHNDAEIMNQTTFGGTTTKCQVGALITGALT